MSVHPSVPVKTREGVHRARQSESRQAQLFLGRPGQHGASHARDVQARYRHEHRPRSLQGRRSGADGGRLRGSADDRHQHGAQHAAHQGRAAASRWRFRPRSASSLLPDLPTIGESLPGFEVTHWYGIWGPEGHAQGRSSRSGTRKWRRELNTDQMKKQMGSRGTRSRRRPAAAALRRHQACRGEVAARDQGREDSAHGVEGWRPLRTPARPAAAGRPPVPARRADRRPGGRVPPEPGQARRNRRTWRAGRPTTARGADGPAEYRCAFSRRARPSASTSTSTKPRLPELFFSKSRIVAPAGRILHGRDARSRAPRSPAGAPRRR